MFDICVQNNNVIFCLIRQQSWNRQQLSASSSASLPAGLLQNSMVYNSDGQFGGDLVSNREQCCPYCSYRSVDKSNYKRHLMVHTKEKPFACPHCYYRCSRKTNLNRHMIHIHKTVPETNMEVSQS